MKKIINHKLFPLILVLIGIFFQMITVYIPTYQFLNAIHYNIEGYIDDVLFNLIEGTYTKFDEHRLEFEIIANYVYRFIDSHENFFEEYSNRFTVSKYGLIFYKRDSGDIPLDYEVQDLYHITTNGWNYAYSNYEKAFSEKFHLSYYGYGTDNELLINYFVFPDYILFSGPDYDIIFTRNRSFPQKYISGFPFIQKSEVLEYPLIQESVVNVIKHAWGWYEIHRTSYSIASGNYNLY